ncbi:hypothetical protein SprV_0301050300 [Sparganum proliferum]
MDQSLPKAAYSAPRIHVNDTQPKTVDNFAYLDRTLSPTIKIDGKVAHRISKASQAFGRLQNYDPMQQQPNNPTPTTALVVRPATTPTLSTKTTSPNTNDNTPYVAPPSITATSLIPATAFATTATTADIPAPAPDDPSSTTLTITLPTTSDGGSVSTCSHCYRTSWISQFGSLLIHGIVTGASVPEAPQIHSPHRSPPSALSTYICSPDEPIRHMCIPDSRVTIVSTDLAYRAHPPTLQSPAQSTLQPPAQALLAAPWWQTT